MSAEDFPEAGAGTAPCPDGEVPTALTRDFLRQGKLQEMVREADPSMHVLTEEELARSRSAIVSRLKPGEDAWVFAYGSLIWNPAFHFEERIQGTAYGYHRDFCLWVYLGRGTREKPGLMLGLRPGGATRGIAYRVAAEAVEEELSIVWRREMVTASYVPRWVRVHTDRGIVPAVTFVIDRHHDRFADGLSQEEVVGYLANGKGAIGTSAEYLFSTVDHLVELGINDRHMNELAAAVRARLSG